MPREENDEGEIYATLTRPLLRVKVLSSFICPSFICPFLLSSLSDFFSHHHSADYPRTFPTCNGSDGFQDANTNDG